MLPQIVIVGITFYELTSTTKLCGKQNLEIVRGKAKGVYGKESTVRPETRP